MKKICCFLSSLLLLSFIFSNELLTPYFENTELDDKKALTFYNESKETFLNNNTEENALLYLDSCRVLSCYYAGGALLKKGRLINGLQKEIEENIDFNKVGAKVLIAYADFLFSEFFWKTNNSDIVQKYPSVCRRALVKDKENKEAKLKYALWCIFPSNDNTNNWNTLIKECENYIPFLNSYDQFNAYIQYSSFYMKSYDTEKGYMYLEKARDLYPNNVLCAVLEANYKKGDLGL